MSSKKTTTTAPATSVPALKIGSRVRCTDDGVTGRIAWANAVSVKVKWDDGEQVTWKRDSLATRPIEILDAEDAAPPEAHREQAPAPATGEQAAEARPTAPEPAPAAPPAAEPVPAVDAPPASEAGSPPPLAPWEAELQAARPEPGDDRAEDTKPETPAADATGSEQGAPARPKRQRKAKTPPAPKEKKLSALDAAARVLAQGGQALTAKEMIGAMAAKGYWTSPGGKTPDATLYAAILREITVKGAQARFVKAAPGRFALRPTA